MARERVDSFSEAKERYREQRTESTAYLVPDIRAGEASAHGSVGTGMDGIAVDPEALVRAERELAELHDDLLGQLRDAGTLAGPLGDGTSPVAAHLRRAFVNRADTEAGVRAALVDYLEELFAVRSAMLRTLEAYQGVDGDLAERLNRQLSQLAKETGR